MSSGSVLIFLFFLITTIAALDPSFYNGTCPDAVSTVQAEVAKIVAKEARMAASILRLHFHDCFVQGCDASILLDETPTVKSEKNAAPNSNSARGFESIDQIKAKLEDICPGVVSCADILALAARDGVVALGGPTWEVPLGRRDSTTAGFDGAENDLPGPGLAFADLLKSFQNKGFTAEEMVTLSGAHTIGFSQCKFFRRRVYNESEIDPAYAKSLRAMCPAEGGDSNLSPFGQSSSVFDNQYYRDIVNERGLLHSDQQLVAEERVKQYSTNSNSFFADFGNAMIKMGSLSPLTGSQGQVRRNCHVVN